jgi:single-stranded DNA-binding protein
MNIVETIGAAADNGKEATQWIRVAAFGPVAEKIAAAARKGDRLYTEGTLTLNEWTDAQGERRTGLNVAAFRCEKVPAIGKNRPRRQHSHNISRQDDHAGPTPYVRSEVPISASTYAGPDYRRELQQVQGIHDFNVAVPF